MALSSQQKIEFTNFAKFAGQRNKQTNRAKWENFLWASRESSKSVSSRKSIEQAAAKAKFWRRGLLRDVQTFALNLLDDILFYLTMKFVGLCITRKFVTMGIQNRKIFQN